MTEAVSLSGTPLTRPSTWPSDACTLKRSIRQRFPLWQKPHLFEPENTEAFSLLAVAHRGTNRQLSPSSAGEAQLAAACGRCSALRPALPGEIFFEAAAFNPGYASRVLVQRLQGRFGVNNIIYIVGLVVVVIAVLSFFGLR